MTLKGSCFKIVSNPWFDRFIISAILANCFFLANDDPTETTSSFADEIAEVVFTFVFFMEMVLKLIALSPSGYFEDKWNWIDFVVVLESISSVIIYVVGFIPGVAISSSESNLSGLRTVRVLRPLKAISFIEEMKLLFDTFFNSLNLALQATLMVGMVVLIFSNAGQIYFSPRGDFRCQVDIVDSRCQGLDTMVAHSFDWTPPSGYYASLKVPENHSGCEVRNTTIFTNQACSGLYQCGTDPCMIYYDYVDTSGIKLKTSDKRPFNCNGTQTCVNDASKLKPYDRLANYRTLWWSMATTFQVITLEGWQDVMFTVQDSASRWVWVYYLVLLFCGAVMLNNLFPAILSVKLEGAIEADKQRKRQEQLAEQDRAAGLSQKTRSEFETIRYEFVQAENEDQKVRQKINDRFKAIYKAEDNVKAPLPRLTPTCFFCQPIRDFITPEWGPFAKFIYLCIFLNILVLSADQDDPTQVQKQIIYYANLVFTVIFAVEAGIKLLVYGPIGYFFDPFNLFDFVVTLLGLLELFISVFGGVTALRIVRICRLGKLLRLVSITRIQRMSMQTSKGSEAMDMPRIIQVLFLAGPWIFYIYTLYLLFIFIFAILGMQFFGTYQIPVDYEEIMMDGLIRINITNPEEMYGFSNFGRAVISVFTIGTTDRWDEIYRFVDEGATSATQGFSFIYFVGVIVLLRWVVLSLIIAVLFDAVHKDGIEVIKIRAKGVMSAIFIMDFAMENYRTKTMFLRWKANVLNEKIAEGKKPQGNNQIEEVPEEVQPTAWTKFKDSKKAFLILGERSKLRTSLKKLERTKAFEGIVFFAIIGSSIAVALEAQQAAAEGTNFTRDTIYAYLDIFCIIVFFFEILVRSFAWGFYFTPMAYLKQSKTHIIDVFVTIASTISLFVSSATVNLNVIRSIRLIRCIRPLQLLARSGAMHNILEALNFAFQPIMIVSVFLVLLLYIFGIVGMQQWAGEFKYCDKPLFDGNSTYYNFPKPGDHLNESFNCGDVDNQSYNFDNVLNGMVSMFLVFTLDGWDEVLRSATASYGDDLEPGTIHYNPWALLYFLIFILFAFVCTTLFIGTIYGTFMYLEHTNQSLPDGRKRQKNSSLRIAHWVLYRQKLEQVRPLAKAPPPAEGTLRRKLYDFCSSQRYRAAVSIFMVTNLSIRYGIGGSYTLVGGFKNAIPFYVWSLERVANCIYVIEWFVRLVAFGCRSMLDFRNGLVFIDFCICVILMITITHVPNHNYSSSMLEFYKLMESLAALRVLRFIALDPGMIELVHTLKKALPAMINLFILLFLMVFFYAVVGLIFFSGYDTHFANLEYDDCAFGIDLAECNDLYSRHLNFKSLANAFNILFGLVTGEHWTTLMSGLFADTDISVKWLVALYFISFTVFARFLVLNLFMMTILFYYHIHSPDQVGVAKSEVENFRNAWVKKSKKAGQTYMHRDKIKDFIRLLDVPLGISKVTSGKDAEWYTKKILEVIKNRTFDFIIPQEETGKGNSKSKGVLFSLRNKEEEYDDGLPTKVSFTDLIVALHYLSFFGAPGLAEYLSDPNRQETRKKIGVLKLAVQRWALSKTTADGGRGSSDEYYVTDLSLVRRSMLDLFYLRLADVLYSQIILWRQEVVENGYTPDLGRECDLLLEVIQNEIDSLLLQSSMVKEILAEHRLGDSKYIQRDQRIKENLRLLRIYQEMVQQEKNEYVENFWVADEVEDMLTVDVSMRHEKGKACNALALSGDGNYLFASFQDKQLRIYKARKRWSIETRDGNVFAPYQTIRNKKTKKKKITLIHSVYLCLATTNDGKKVFCGGQDNRIYVFMQESKVGKKDKNKKKMDYIESSTMIGHRGSVYALRLHGAFLLSAGADGVIHMWRTRGKEPVQTISLSKGTLGFGKQAIYNMTLHQHLNEKDDKMYTHLFAGGQDCMVHAMPVKTDPNFLNTEVWKVECQHSAFSDDKKTKSGEMVTALAVAWGYLYVGGSKGSVQVLEMKWDTSERIPILGELEHLKNIYVHNNVICTMVYESGVLFTGSHDLSIIAWRKPAYIKDEGEAKGDLNQSTANGFVGHGAEINSMCASGTVLVSSDAAGQIIVRAPEKRTEVCNSKRLRKITPEFLKRQYDRDEKADNIVMTLTNKKRKGLTFEKYRKAAGQDDEYEEQLHLAEILKKDKVNLEEIKRPKALDNCTSDIYLARVMKAYYSIQKLQDRAGKLIKKGLEVEDKDVEEENLPPSSTKSKVKFLGKMSKSLSKVRQSKRKKNEQFFDDETKEVPDAELDVATNTPTPKTPHARNFFSKLAKARSKPASSSSIQLVGAEENGVDEMTGEGVGVDEFKGEIKEEFEDGVIEEKGVENAPIPMDHVSDVSGGHPSEPALNSLIVFVGDTGSSYAVNYVPSQRVEYVAEEARRMYEDNFGLSGVKPVEIQKLDISERVPFHFKVSDCLQSGENLRLVIDESSVRPLDMLSKSRASTEVASSPSYSGSSSSSDEYSSEGSSSSSSGGSKSGSEDSGPVSSASDSASEHSGHSHGLSSDITASGSESEGSESVSGASESASDASSRSSEGSVSGSSYSGSGSQDSSGGSSYGSSAGSSGTE
mmetsp:Transcript_29320/g.38551  ORF Transcript_29320/g.38551 Transcript_29320/m.38551 type:complete len:2569 (+) Transcript_29320:180-7886(+)